MSRLPCLALLLCAILAHGPTRRVRAGAPGTGASGALYGSFLEPQGIFPVRESAKISALEGGFAGPLEDGDAFGASTASIGDLDGDGLADLAAGAPGAGDGTSRGALWILFSNPDRSVRSSVEIGAGTGGFAGSLVDHDRFGSAVVGLGDVDGDGVGDVAVGAPGSGDFAPAAATSGSVWVLFLDPDGTVKSHQEIGDGSGGLSATLLHDFDLFGTSLAALGDVDGNGVVDLAVGAPGNNDYDDFGQNCFHFCCDTVGAVWILFLGSDGTVQDSHEISAGSGDLPFHLDVEDMFGNSVAALGDLDGDGTVDLAAGSPFTDCQDFGAYGAAYVLFLAPDGSVQAARRLTEGESGVAGLVEWGAYLGWSLASAGDLDLDGVCELVAFLYDDGSGSASGAAWLLFLRSDGTVKKMQKISSPPGGFADQLEDGDAFGSGLGAMSDFDGDGGVELLVGAPGDDDGGADRGAVWWLDLRRTRRALPTAGPPSPR